VEQQRALIGRRRAFERNPQDRNQHPPAGERRQDLTQALCAGDGVVLVTVLHKARRGGRVVIGAQRHDQDVGLVGAAVGDHVTGLRIDRRDLFLAELDPASRDVPIRVADLFAGLPAEQDLQLGEPEDERVILVNEGDVHLIAQRRRQPRGQLQPSETGTQDQYMQHHAGSMSRGSSACNAVARSDAALVSAGQFAGHPNRPCGQPFSFISDAGARDPPAGPARGCSLITSGPFARADRDIAAGSRFT
jgi:hypothetical protein